MIKQQTKKPQPQKPATTTKRRKSTDPLQELTFLEHIYELRNRLFWIVGVLIVTSSIGFQYKDVLVNFIMSPLHGEKLIYLTPGGGFSFIFTVCLYFGAFLTIPVIIFHLYGFLQPVLGKASRKFVVLIVTMSAFLAACGATFGYMVAIPAAITFLTTFAGDAVSPNLTADSYLSFVIMYLLGLAALFQLPLILFILDHVRPFPPGTLLTSQRFVIVGAIIAAALITPTPDVVNQLIVAGPIIVIYQLGALAIYVRRRAERRSTAKKQKQVSRAYRPPTRVTSNDEDDAIDRLIMDMPVVTATTPALAKTGISKISTAKNIPTIKRTVRNIDGFSRRPSRHTVVVPSRTNLSQRSVERPMIKSGTTGRTVSLDGFAIPSQA